MGKKLYGQLRTCHPLHARSEYVERVACSRAKREREREGGRGGKKPAMKKKKQKRKRKPSFRTLSSYIQSLQSFRRSTTFPTQFPREFSPENLRKLPASLPACLLSRFPAPPLSSSFSPKLAETDIERSLAPNIFLSRPLPRRRHL